jgi:hypothetical protein
MGPTQVDPLIHARSIVRKCMVRDACTELAAATLTQKIAALRAFGRHDGAPSANSASNESRSSGDEGIAKRTARGTAKIETVAFVLLSCMIMIIFVLGASTTSLVHH